MLIALSEDRKVKKVRELKGKYGDLGNEGQDEPNSVDEGEGEERYRRKHSVSISTSNPYINISLYCVENEVLYIG